MDNQRTEVIIIGLEQPVSSIGTVSVSLLELLVIISAKIGTKIARIRSESLYPANKSEMSFGLGQVFKTDFCLLK